MDSIPRKSTIGQADNRPSWVYESGGRKNLQLRLHKDEVLSYLSEHGPDATRDYYKLTATTFNRLVSNGYKTPEKTKKLDIMRDKFELVRSDNAAMRRELRELRELFGNFTEVVSDQLTEKFFKPLIQSAIALPPGFEPQPPDVRLNIPIIDKREIAAKVRQGFKENDLSGSRQNEANKTESKCYVKLIKHKPKQPVSFKVHKVAPLRTGYQGTPRQRGAP